MKVVLIGLRGVGKTTVGRKLARRLSLPFRDTDSMVEARSGMTVSQILRTHGEMAFRDRETFALRQIARAKGDLVAAAGGGAVLRPENQVLLPKVGRVVYLFARPDLLRQRLARSRRRPSLTGKPVEEEIEFLFITRDPLYRDLADLVVQVGHRSAERIAEEIAQKLSRIPKRLPKLRRQE